MLLLVSGGHCQILRVDGWNRFTRLGGTIDDAPGEAFDKVARLLGLPQPGGPSVEAEARAAIRPVRVPRPLLDRPGSDMSFSGLKTAVLRARDRLVASNRAG
jgi:N6-L-threonylcarbamoyladenine synthase